MSEFVYGIHLLVLVTFVSIIGDVVKQFTKRFRDKNFQPGNLGSSVGKSVEDVINNVSKLNEGVEMQSLSQSDKIKSKDGNGNVDNGSNRGNNDNGNEDGNDSSGINNPEQMMENGQMNMNAALGGVKNFILLVIDNMLPHFIFGKIYKRYNGFFMDQEKNFPPLLWIDFLPQEQEGSGIASLNRFISFAIARSALSLVYSIIYPLIYGVQYKPETQGS